MPGPTKLFVSYSHEDRKWLERLQIHFKALERDGSVDLWDDTDIKLGTRWDDEIVKALDEAQVAILLVSATFMASSYIVKEQRMLLEANKRENLLILVVVLSPCMLGELGQFQTVNDPEEPLVGLTFAEQERVFVKLARTIKKQLAVTPEASASQPAAAHPAQASKPVRLRVTKTDSETDDVPEELVFQKERFTIGRDHFNDLSLSHATQAVSKKHAELYWENDRLYLVDLESLNCTYLNDEEVAAHEPVEVKAGDTISVGSFEIVVDILDEGHVMDVPAGVEHDSTHATRISPAIANPYMADVRELVEVIHRIGERYAGEASGRSKRVLQQTLDVAMKLEPEKSAYPVIAASLLRYQQRKDAKA